MLVLCMIILLIKIAVQVSRKFHAKITRRVLMTFIAGNMSDGVNCKIRDSETGPGSLEGLYTFFDVIICHCV